MRARVERIPAWQIEQVARDAEEAQALLAALDRIARRQRAWQTVGRWALLVGFLAGLTAIAAFPVR